MTNHSILLSHGEQIRTIYRVMQRVNSKRSFSFKSSSNADENNKHLSSLKNVDDISIDSITSDDIFWNPSLEEKKYNLSFAGCGFLGLYHLGACKSLFSHGKLFLDKVEKFGGASAGSMVAAVMATKGFDEETLQAGIQFCHDSYARATKKKFGMLTPNYCILDDVETFLRAILPPDAHEKATGRLFISLTKAKSKKNIMVSQFKTYEDLISCVLASSCVPLVTGSKPIIWNGKKYIDGGISQNLPDIPGAQTIFVSPFSGGKQISPNDTSSLGWGMRVNGEDVLIHPNNVLRAIHAFFPPKHGKFEEYFRYGSKNAINFLKKENLFES